MEWLKDLLGDMGDWWKGILEDLADEIKEATQPPSNS